MNKKAGYVLFSAVGIVALTVALILLKGWLNRPLPIPLNDPESQPIKDVLIKSYKIEGILICEPESDINLLDEVLIDSPEYKRNNNDQVLIARYLGESANKHVGYLTFRKAYHLWARSGDPYPRPSTNLTPDSSTKLAPTQKPMRYCPDSASQSDLIFRSIAVREDKAVVIVDVPGSINEAILIRFGSRWFIGNIRVLHITV
jgi:hypothetical protein